MPTKDDEPPKTEFISLTHSSEVRPAPAQTPAPRAPSPSPPRPAGAGSPFGRGGFSGDRANPATAEMRIAGANQRRLGLLLALLLAALLALGATLLAGSAFMLM